MRKSRLVVLVVGITLAANGLVAFVLREKSAGCGTHAFINRLITCDYEETINKKGYAEFKAGLNEYIDQEVGKGKVSLVAVWFRDLEFGPTFGINDRNDFIPASLLKLPLAMAFLELAEDDPAVLEQMITYSGSGLKVPNQVFVPTQPTRAGTYTIGDLIARAIVYSDNVASQLLYDHLRTRYPGALSQTYRNLGILEPGTDLDLAVVNTKGYGSIFRLLFNASFLNKEASERLLGLLAQSEFQEGLRAGVPADIVIAHKFGERNLANGEHQLHDCGIVYYPENPYQLCVMTRGDSYDELKGVIQEISKRVYQEFDSRRL